MFTPDAQCDYRATGGRAGTWGDIKPWLIEALGGFGTTQHLIGMPQIRFDGVDGDRATASSLWMHVRRGEDDHPLLPTLGGYTDELIREDGRWRFLSRSVSPLIPAS